MYVVSSNNPKSKSSMVAVFLLDGRRNKERGHDGGFNEMGWESEQLELRRAQTSSSLVVFLTDRNNNRTHWRLIQFQEIYFMEVLRISCFSNDGSSILPPVSLASCLISSDFCCDPICDSSAALAFRLCWKF